MIWLSVAVADFQSYGDQQTVTLDPKLTLLAGRNDVGKSALMRAIRVWQQPQEGAGPNFMLRCTWEFSSEELLHLLLPPGTSSNELEQWIASEPVQTVTATFVRGGANNPMQPDDLFCQRIDLRELEAFAEGAPGSALGWTGGPFAGSSGAADSFQNVSRDVLSAGISYVSPRRVEQGARQLVPNPTLAPDASNLTNVVHYLILNERPTLARLERFISEAFPYSFAARSQDRERGSMFR
jgi:hypothetical protein